MVELSELEPEGSLELKAERVVTELRKYVKTGRCKTLEWRLQQLKGVLKLLKEREEDIGEALRRDLGKSAYEVYVTEISIVQSSCEHMIKDLAKWMAPQKVTTPLVAYPSKCSIVPEPFGVALIISAWNFPFVLAFDPLLGAIAAGNAAVIKPSEVAPASAKLIAKLVPQYLDGNAIRVIEGAVAETTALLEQKWDKIFYTGSPRIGRVIMSAAAKHLTPVTLELGGKCPTIIDSTADLKVAVRRIAVGKWGSNNGQTCISPDYILAEEAIVPKLVETLKSTITGFYGEDPKLSVDLSRVVNSNHLGRLKSLLDDQKAENIVVGGNWDEKSLYLAPTVLVNPSVDSSVMAEEIFGPILPIISVKSMDEAVDFVNSRPKPLALYVFTKSKEVGQQFVADTSAGAVVINDTVLHFVVPGLPFGGVGESGMGNYHGKRSFDAFSHNKAVVTRGYSGDNSARYPPYDKYKQNLVRSLLSGDFFGVILTLLGLKK
eukprot:TRINITY_DN6855_c0_g1_i1.p1 TRINITY_DN6855_c0_g1~~TRINITY_DN6855_c0_g1_i1.p1  ORF type:complete len:515 (-),score=76.65 TRINITY_DN6855_c0_g1_i1:335-1804(-)